MIKVYTADSLFEAKQIEENLAERDINCKIKVNSYLTMPNAIPKEIYEIFVLEEEAGHAAEMLGEKKVSHSYTEPRRKRIARISAICLVVIVFLILVYSIMKAF